jgi:hypothetical protein
MDKPIVLDEVAIDVVKRFQMDIVEIQRKILAVLQRLYNLDGVVPVEMLALAPHPTDSDKLVLFDQTKWLLEDGEFKPLTQVVQVQEPGPINQASPELEPLEDQDSLPAT